MKNYFASVVNLLPKLNYLDEKDVYKVQREEGKEVEGVGMGMSRGGEGEIGRGVEKEVYLEEGVGSELLRQKDEIIMKLLNKDRKSRAKSKQKGKQKKTMKGLGNAKVKDSQKVDNLKETIKI